MSEPILSPLIYPIDLNELTRHEEYVHTCAGIWGYSPWIPRVGNHVIAEDEDGGRWDATVMESHPGDSGLIRLRLGQRHPVVRVRVQWVNR